MFSSLLLRSSSTLTQPASMCWRAWLLGSDEQRLHQANGSKNLRPQRRATLIDHKKVLRSILHRLG
jgi:hypothetical protein